MIYQEINMDIIIFEDEILNNLALTSLNGLTWDIAKVFHNKFGKYFFLDNKKNHYYFDKKWIKSGNVYQMVLDKLICFYEEIHAISLLNENLGQYSINILNILNKLIKQRRQSSCYLVNQITDFYICDKRKLNESLNKNKTLLGFNNGTYDFNNFTFRDGLPEDDISLSVNYDFKYEYSEHKNDLLQFLEYVEPDTATRIYLLKVISLSLTNHKIDFLHILIGKTNIKKFLNDLIAHTFGEYYISCDSSFITTYYKTTKKIEQNTKILTDKRIIVIDEPGFDKKINTVFLKRMLEQKYMILFCDEIFKLDRSNESIWWRLSCHDLTTELSDNPMLTYQKPMIENISEKLFLWKNDFMLLIIEHYKLYLVEYVRMTNKIEETTKKYKDLLSST